MLWGRGGKWFLPAPLFLVESPLRQDLKPVNYSPSHMLYMLFKLLLLCCISAGLFVTLSLEGCGLSFISFSEQIPLIFKILGFKCLWL